MNNLQSWQPGKSGNPNGRPVGSRNLKNIVREMLDSPDTYKLLPIESPQDTSTPLEAIICTLMVKSIAGDVKAADVLLKYAIDRDIPLEMNGFFSRNEMTFRIIGSKYHGEPELDAVTGQLVSTPPL